MQLIVIHNARAGRKQKRIRSKITQFFARRGIPCEIQDYVRCDWEKVQRICESDPQTRIVVAGGDGTLRRVIEFLWQRRLLNHPVAFVPMGSGNLVAYSLRLPFNMRHAFENAIVGAPKALDLGILNDKYVFFLGAAMGKVTMITSRTERSLKKRFGLLAYILRIPWSLSGGYTEALFNVRLHNDTPLINENIRTHSFLVLNHLNVARLEPRRGVLANDGMLDVVTMHNTNFFGFILGLFSFYFGKGHSRMIRHFQTPTIRAEFEGFKEYVNLDGDYIEYPGSPLNFKVLPQAVLFIH